MKKAKGISMYLLLISLFISASLFGANFTNVPVGTKVSDTTSTVTINVSQIQSLIVPTIGSLKTSTVLSTNVQILTGSRDYLIFSVVSSGDTMSVAIELKLVGSSLSFEAGNKTGVHVCKLSGACNSCMFTRNRQGRIIGCSCSDVSAERTWECKHYYEKTIE
jgi:hypothetical protein